MYPTLPGFELATLFRLKRAPTPLGHSDGLHAQLQSLCSAVLVPMYYPGWMKALVYNYQALYRMVILGTHWELEPGFKSEELTTTLPLHIQMNTHILVGFIDDIIIEPDVPASTPPTSCCDGRRPGRDRDRLITGKKLLDLKCNFEPSVSNGKWLIKLMRLNVFVRLMCFKAPTNSAIKSSKWWCWICWIEQKKMHNYKCYIIHYW